MTTTGSAVNMFWMAPVQTGVSAYMLGCIHSLCLHADWAGSDLVQPVHVSLRSWACIDALTAPCNFGVGSSTSSQHQGHVPMTQGETCRHQGLRQPTLQVILEHVHRKQAHTCAAWWALTRPGALEHVTAQQPGNGKHDVVAGDAAIWQCLHGCVLPGTNSHCLNVYLLMQWE